MASTAARRDASRPCIDGGAPLIRRSITRLPGRRSPEFIRWEIRSHSDVPVIITTGHRPDEIDRIVGLELGADDYIVKPFSLRELLARVRAVLRRQEMGRVARTRDPERGGYRLEGWQLERRGRRLFDPNATPVALSKGEYALLLAFLERPQRPLSREHLSQATRIRIFSIAASMSRSCGRGASCTARDSDRARRWLRVRAAGPTSLKAIKMWRHAITVVTELSTPVMIP
jgi:two-component system OmpR family response regulator